VRYRENPKPEFIRCRCRIRRAGLDHRPGRDLGPPTFIGPRAAKPPRDSVRHRAYVGWVRSDAACPTKVGAPGTDGLTAMVARAVVRMLDDDKDNERSHDF
jgi:hypothetical protein